VSTGSGDFKGGEMGRSRTERGDLSLLELEDERTGLKIDKLESRESRWLVRDLLVVMLSCRGDKGTWTTVGCSGKDGY
jgi:hypothetical protein